MSKDLSPEELRAALAAADRGMRLPWGAILLSTGLAVVAIAVALRFADVRDDTHVLIVSAAIFLWAQMQLLAGIIATRQNAANARMLRALELLDERPGGR